VHLNWRQVVPYICPVVCESVCVRPFIQPSTYTYKPPYIHVLVSRFAPHVPPPPLRHTHTRIYQPNFPANRTSTHPPVYSLTRRPQTQPPICSAILSSPACCLNWVMCNTEIATRCDGGCYNIGAKNICGRSFSLLLATGLKPRLGESTAESD
jgi:hypothetical protein